MKRIVLFITAATLLAVGCKKDEAPAPAAPVDFQTLKREVLTDFSHKVALASYADLRDAASKLQGSVAALESNTNEAHLDQARADWKAMRSIWEQCEGFLFGPVDVNEYDPQMDTWPTDYNQIDSLLASGASLEPGDIAHIAYSLRGYHPLEYLLFGNNGERKPSDLSARELKYLTSLSADLSGICTQLYNSWAGAPESYALQVAQSGTPQSTAYEKMQHAYLDIVGSMIEICEEVGEGKIYDPFMERDPQIVESPYSGNSWADFEDNLRGLQNVYLGRYKEQGRGVADLVAAKNKSLDHKIQGRINAALSSFATVRGVPFEKGILITAERVKIQKVMDVLNTLKTTLEEELQPFVIQYVTD